ncbi:DUF2799 domain-containing protein [Pseudoalteromonas sp. KG3]|uniref:DUF2799 domain-containing protein n=1 Tax=Pseudoalteromonas prydzensis TaxID=182141 RepID=A0ABR9FIS6_9GAMM|nr:MULTISPECIES: DUF2799 domain-containing protein [Pseudoalteromonas]MBE0456735.1 DUF2799 domain-containing protein [Pseudoalteromonas prydzensis]WKD22814.1 DUF2799 domain-containing protein [Pseudoalteromonas sp. KG3]
MPHRVLLLLFFIVLSGCTSLSQQECAEANWQQLGYSHGQQGYTYERGKEIIATCREFGITAQLSEYQASYQQGLAVYCEPENGFTLGIRGESYNGVCNNTQFRKAWQEGNDRYQLEERKAEIEQRLDEIEWRLNTIRDELSAETVGSNKRKELHREREMLEDERRDLIRERSLLPLLNNLPSVHVEYEL